MLDLCVKPRTESPLARI